MNAAVTALVTTAIGDKEFWSQVQTGESLPTTGYIDNQDQFWIRNPISNLDRYRRGSSPSEGGSFYEDTSVIHSSWTDNRYELVADQLIGFLADVEKKRQTQRIYRLSYKLRICILQHEAVLDGIGLNKDSLLDFWSFVESESYVRKANLVLMDNGNLRAIWKGGNGNRIGLQFLGDRSVESVIFKNRSTNRGFSRVIGQYTIDEFIKHILALDMAPLLFE